LNLGRSFVLGSVYLGGGQVVINAVNLAMQLAIARLLGPEVFGLYAFCLAITEFLSILGAVSLGFALIQAREVSQEDYDTAFVFYLGLGLLGLMLVAGIAPWLAEARSTEAAWLLLIMWSSRVLRMLAQRSECDITHPVGR
jgi:PST family polysaccharide transporter